MSVKLILSAPIQAHGEEVRELSFRELTSKDIRTLGFPFTTNKEGQTVIEAGVIGRYIVALAGIPTSSVDQMRPSDFMKAMEIVSGFFGMETAS